MSAPGTQPNSRWQRVQDLFHATASLPASEWMIYLRSVCSDDSELISEVMAMLQEDARGASLLDRQLPELAHSLLAGLPGSLMGEDFRQYRIEALLGEGGAGTVYLAERSDLGSKVAIKLLSSGVLSPMRRQRFTEEQRTLAELDHPFIARIFDADTLQDGTPWFAMEYVKGQPVTRFCQTRAHAVDDRLRLFQKICEAVQYAQGRAVIHLDLKPSNILVKDDGTVKLLDFGIARHLEQPDQKIDSTRTGRWQMTPAYASPEQLRGEPLGIQTDVYSLGVILYELLSDKLPCEVSGKSITELAGHLLEYEVTPPSQRQKTNRAIGKGAWSDLDVLCLTAMHRDLGRRYSSVEALLRDLNHYFQGQPLEARADTLRYRMGKFVRRNQRVLSGTLAALLVLGFLAIFFTVRLAREHNAVLAEAKRTQRIEGFMLNLFDGGDKTAAPSDTLRAVTLIDRGVKNASVLANEPAIQADLYQTLGNMYQELGRFDEANKLLLSARDQHKALNGADSPEEAQSLVALGLLRLDQSKIDDAEPLVRQGLAMEKRHLPLSDPIIGAGMSALGRVLNERGSYSDAIKLLEEAVKLQTAQNSTSATLSTAIAELAIAHYYSGHFALADELNKKALAMDKQLYGNFHPRVADDLIDLGEIQHDMGHEAAAEQYYRQALEIKQSWYSSDHPETAIAMSGVGQALVYQGRYDEAAGLLQRALSIQERFFGKVHSQVAMTVNLLAMLDLKHGHLEAAEAEFGRMADINRAIYGKRHYLVGVSLLNLAEVYSQEKQYARAESTLRNVLALLNEILPPAHQLMGIVNLKLGHTLLLQRRFKEAEPYLIAGYQNLSKQTNPPAARIAVARADLAQLYESLHKPDVAKSFRFPTISISKTQSPATQ